MKTILVVEDEPTIAEVLLRVLEEEGYKVVLASNGRQGLDVLAQTQPDLVLSDLMMPVLNGVDMYRSMLTDAVLSHIPVILMSAAATPPTIIDKKANYVGFLRKPFVLHELLHLVSLALGSLDG